MIVYNRYKTGDVGSMVPHHLRSTRLLGYSTPLDNPHYRCDAACIPYDNRLHYSNHSICTRSQYGYVLSLVSGLYYVGVGSGGVGHEGSPAPRSGRGGE